MKQFILTLAMITAVAATAQVKTLKPASTWKWPSVSFEQYQLLETKADMGKLTKAEEAMYDQCAIFDDLYSGKCSWYCGGEVLNIVASSKLHNIKGFTYNPSNAHDFDHETAWAEGVDGQGIGEYLEYEFAGGCPRITTVKILNGYAKNAKVWKNNSRVKKLRMYYNNQPVADLLLNDTRDLQLFEVGTLGPHNPDAPNWTLRFEILEVYPGAVHDDTVISELYFDGIDVH